MKQVPFLGAVILLPSAFATPDHASAQQKPHARDVSFTLPFEFVDNRILGNTRIGDRTIVMVLDTGADGTALEDFTNVFGSKTPGGILGKPVFERFEATIDHEHRQLTFTPLHDCVKPAGATSLPEQIPVIRATLDGATGSFGVDIGARSSLPIYGPVAREHKLRETCDARFEGVTGWGLGGPIRSLLVRANAFSFAGFDVPRPVVRLSLQASGLTTSTGMAGLVGPDVLARFNIAFDHANRTMYPEQDAPSPSPTATTGPASGWDKPAPISSPSM